jgi:cold shock CspA family protein
MWALRNSSSSTRFARGIARLQGASPQSFVAAPHPRSCARPFSSDEGGEYFTGKVKFYLRDKAYGFIVPDDGVVDEIWVHRTSLDTPHSPEEFPTRPYLQRDERVKFRVEKAAAGQSSKATGVRFENGRQVPLFRKNYHAAVVRGEMQRLGEAVYDILRQDDLSDDDRLEQIKMVGKAAEENISLAAERQEQFGPEPELGGPPASQ